MRLQRHLGLGQGDMVVKDLPGTVPKAEAATVCAGRGAESADRKQERKFQGRYAWVCKESDTTQQVNNNNSAKYLLAPSGRRKG